jgi:glycosyltransferase involved in cell wall biosynthesis
MTPPKITVITVCLNAQAHIEQTIESVVGQSYPDIEYIVVDGGSSDATLDIVRRHEGGIAKWLSEPDEGIADAMNKGLALATGDYVIFLHADDYLLDDSVIERAAGALDRRHEIFAFEVLYAQGESLRRLPPRGFTWAMNFKTGILHQGAICRRSLFDRIGPFDTRFAIAMDYEFFLRAYRSGVALKVVPFPLSVMRDTGVSSRRDWPSLRRRFGEERRIHSAHSKAKLQMILYAGYWAMYLPYRWVRTLFAE